MRNLPVQAAAIVIAGCLVFSGCNKSSTPSPTPTATPQIANMSGDYTGTVTDSVSANSGTVNTGVLAQHGSNAGGVLVNTTSAGALNLAMSLSVNSSNSVIGSMVVDYPSGTTCTYNVTGTYTNSGSPPVTLNGTYSAVTNCAGESGSFALTQQCSDTVTAAERRTMTVPAAC
jgi:hypothetical protein